MKVPFLLTPKVYFIHKEEVLVTARDSIAHLTVLDALFNFGGIDVSGKNCYKVPPGVEFGEYPLILLRTYSHKF